MKIQVGSDFENFSNLSFLSPSCLCTKRYLTSLYRTIPDLKKFLDVDKIRPAKLLKLLKFSKSDPKDYFCLYLRKRV
jgi:hypothetical protein